MDYIPLTPVNGYFSKNSFGNFKITHISLPSHDNASQFGPSPNIGTVAFDSHQELLWVGDNYGHISSFIWDGDHLKRYTALQAHLESEGPVHQFLFNERGVVSLAARSVHFSKRTCLTQWHLEDSGMTRLSCMTFLSKDSRQLLVAGCQKVMFKVDVEKGNIIERIDSRSEYTMMKSHRYICAATSSGAVDFLDPATLDVLKTWQAHTATINSMDARDDFLLTCGWSTRPHGNTLGLDAYVKVFDLKALEQFPPISFHWGAAFVQIHPKMSSTSIIASQKGQFEVTDIMRNEDKKMIHVTLASSLTHMCLSSSGNVWAMADQDNVIRLWSSLLKSQFNGVVNPTESADNVAPVDRIAVNADLPFSTVGMPYYHDKLLSAWGNDRIFQVGKPPATIDPEILANARRGPGGIGLIMPNTPEGPRNQVDYSWPVGSNGDVKMAPKRPSDKARTSDNGHTQFDGVNDVTMSFADFALSSHTADAPYGYEELRISYGGPRGVQDFDFGYYNRTHYSGLENDITNSYMNTLLQILRFTPQIRNLALFHVAGSCPYASCLLCELGFLCDMLEKAGESSGKVCRATNFFKTYSSQPEAAKTSTVEEFFPQNSLEARLLAASHYLLQQIYGCPSFSRSVPSADRIITSNAVSTQHCLKCHHESPKAESPQIINLLYSDSNIHNRHRNPTPSFTEVLEHGFQKEIQRQGWCERCRSYKSPIMSRRTITSIPEVLILDPDLEKNPRNRSIWATPHWLPREIGIACKGINVNITCFEGDQVRNYRNYPSSVIYELVGIVVDIASSGRQKHHLVSFVDVAISAREPTKLPQWQLFNDFMVGPVSQQEALNFAPMWKTPVLLVYQKQTARHSINDSWKDWLDPTCLYNQGSIIQNPSADGRPLVANLELPRDGTHVAIDAEFIVLQREAFDINADGEKKTTRPVRQGLGRVSALRGSGDMEGAPFIDDFVIVHEQIIDYVTQFSGIELGDLDPYKSTKAPVSLKMAYKKLWLLLNLGCIFVGHGLTSDFRHANMFVPDSQSIDTSLLFKKGERTLKLSLLADFFLKEEIQTGNHDSIEDARTALRLWRKYQEFERLGTVEKMIDDVYRYGRKHQYNPAHHGRGALGGSGAEMKGSSSTDLISLGGRSTPEVGGSRPITPLGRGRGGDVGGLGIGGYGESPLR